MDPDARALNYILVYDDNDGHAVRRGGMTPAQRRRWVRKLHRTGGRWPADGKGRPTPRRPRRG
jgi:transposase-like protein